MIYKYDTLKNLLNFFLAFFLNNKNKSIKKLY